MEEALCSGTMTNIDARTFLNAKIQLEVEVSYFNCSIKIWFFILVSFLYVKLQSPVSVCMEHSFHCEGIGLELIYITIEELLFLYISIDT